MRIHLVQPPAGRPAMTGGYRYNSAVGGGLAATGAGGLVEVAPDHLRAWCSRFHSGPADEVAVFDSLYLPLFGAPHRLRLGARTRLLLHYLPSGVHGLSSHRRRQLETIENAWVAAAGGVITTSRRLAKAISRRCAAPVQAAPPGIEAFFSPAPEPAAGGGKALTVIAVGSLIPDKGQLGIAAALARRPQGSMPVRLWLVGDHEADPAYTEAIRAAAAGFDLELTGSVPARAVAERLRAADLFASASAHESYGMAAAEAVATGIPVLAYRVGEIDEWVRDGQSGFLVEPGDETGFRERLLALLEEPSRLARLRSSRPPRFPTWKDTCRDFRAACLGPESASVGG